MTRIQEVTKTILSINNPGELRQLGDVIQNRWKALQNKARGEALKHIRPGVMVSFYSKGGAFIKGKVVKINPKTVSVDSETGSKWRVSPLTLTIENKKK